MDNESIRIEFVNGSSIFAADEYELVIENGRLEIKKKEAPDFGELSPSQELNDFVNTLVQGK